MNRFVASAMLILMLIWGVPVNADVVRVPGVHVGDWVRYGWTINYTTNDPDAPVPPPPPDFLEFEHYTVEVISVSGTNITVQVTIRLGNGTETSSTEWVDVSWGYWMVPPLFIAANLSPEDTIYRDTYWPTINATLTLTYAGVEREVNYVRQLQNVSGMPPRYWLVGDLQMHWDRVTGTLDEYDQKLRFVELSRRYTTNISAHLIIEETSIWGPAAQFGDLNGDQKVDIEDIAIAALAFGSFPGHLRWNPIADLNEDDRVGMKDILIVARNFGKTYL